jgi:hypothetical protein
MFHLIVPSDEAQYQLFCKCSSIYSDSWRGVKSYLNTELVAEHIYTAYWVACVFQLSVTMEIRNVFVRYLLGVAAMWKKCCVRCTWLLLLLFLHSAGQSKVAWTSVLGVRATTVTKWPYVSVKPVCAIQKHSFFTFWTSWMAFRFHNFLWVCRCVEVTLLRAEHLKENDHFSYWKVLNYRVRGSSGIELSVMKV